MDGWGDHHHISTAEAGGAGVYPDIIAGEGYDPHNTKMEDFDASQYGHDVFQQNQVFEGDAQEFQNYMVVQQHQGIMGDQHDHHHAAGNESGYEIDSMELYHHNPTIYPNLTQSQESPQQQQYGTYTHIELSLCLTSLFCFILWGSDVLVVDQSTSSSSTVSVPQNDSNNPNSTAGGGGGGGGGMTTDHQAYAQTSQLAKDPSPQIGRQFKFTADQKQKMAEKFNAGLHYPTPAEKEAIGNELGVASDSVLSPYMGTVANNIGLTVV
jgi:hypothetical protein